MPLRKGKSNAAREANIKTEVAAGRDPKQAVAIGYSEQREARKKMASKKYGDMHMGGEHNDVVDEYGKHVEAGKDGSHQERHKGVRGAIHVGSPTELEKHHDKEED